LSGALATLFDALHAERERTWPAEKLHANIAQRQALVDAFDPAAVVQAGDRVEPFELETPGGTITLDDLLRKGPTLLIFFRFAGCPACNIALPFYDRELVPELRRRGVQVIAVTPHLQAAGADEIRQRHALSYAVATDRDNALARRFGIAFHPLTPPVPAGDGWIGALTGTGTGELPQPALILIDEDKVVRFADVSPDWLRRTEPEALLAALGAVPQVPATAAA
jgi:peroxiredoxin